MPTNLDWFWWSVALVLWFLCGFFIGSKRHVR